MVALPPNVLGHIRSYPKTHVTHRPQVRCSFDSPKRHSYQDLMSLYYLLHL